MKWETIRELLIQRIAEGVYPRDKALPSERALAEEFSVARATLRQALQSIADDGMLYAVHGRGYFIRTSEKGGMKIAVLVSGYAYTEIFSELVKSIRSDAMRLGLGMALWNASCDDPELSGERALEMAQELVRTEVSGVIYQPIQFCSRAEYYNRRILEIFRESHLPVVLIDCALKVTSADQAYDFVSMDNFRAGYTLAEHLTKTGSRQIRFLVRPGYGPSVRDRIQGLIAVQRGIDPLWTADPKSVREIEKMIRLDPSADTIICQNDLVAVELIGTLTELGFRVPKDFRVAGFDAVKAARTCNPPLTTIRQPTADLARSALESLRLRIANPRSCTRLVLLQGPLILRGSC